jgi:hypothetical protein
LTAAGLSQSTTARLPIPVDPADPAENKSNHSRLAKREAVNIDDIASSKPFSPAPAQRRDLPQPQGVVIPTRAAAYSEAPGVGGVAVQIQRFLAGNPEAAKYISGLSRDDKYPVSWSLTKVFQWLSKRLGIPLDGIVARLLDQQEEANVNRSERKRMAIEDLLVEFSTTMIHGTTSYKMRFHNVTHGLFHKHHVDLPWSDEAAKIRGERANVQGVLTLNEIRRVIDAAKPPERAAFALMFQGFHDRERFKTLNETAWPEIKRQLDDSSTKWVRIKFDSRKRNDQPYYVMYHKDGDAIQFLKRYLENRGEPRALGRDERGNMRYEPIILNGQGEGISKNSLSSLWTTAAVRAGVIERATVNCESCDLPMVKRKFGHGGNYKGRGWGSWYVCRRCNLREKASSYRERLQVARYGKNLHEIRDTLITVLPTLAGVNDSLVQFFSGHQVDPLNYKKFRNLEDDWVEKEWSKARPFLDLWSNQTVATREKLEEQNKQLREEVDKVKSRQDRMEAAYWKGQAARVQRGIDYLDNISPDDPLPQLSDEQIIEVLKRRKAALTNSIEQLEEDNGAPIAPVPARAQTRERKGGSGN